jgi:putative uncharacterized protein (fragment)|nr:MAG TPA: adenine-specific methyltransferase [Caudoviricetes sp.]
MGKSNRSIYAPLGASNHVKNEREKNDYYATDPKAIDFLLKRESFENVLEPACGEGHLSKRLILHGIKTTSYDLIDRGFGEVKDFFEIQEWKGDLITNPPYKIAQEFVTHALRITKNGRKIAMFLKIQFLEGQARRKMFLKYPPKKIYVFSKRIVCAKNGDFESIKSSAVAYAWFLWEKDFKGNPEIEWID